MSDYAKYYKKNQTPQTEKADDSQIPNNAGGFSFEISDWQRLRRFLILGSDNGTYYVDKITLTRENAKCVERCLEIDAHKTLDIIVEVSDSGKAVKNDIALFALALAASSDNEETRSLALEKLPKIARISTHLFQFSHFVDSMRGWGPGLRKAIAKWYNEKDASHLAYQVAKYPQRKVEEKNGSSVWSHRDLLRKTHPKTESSSHQVIYNHITQGELEEYPSDLAIFEAKKEINKAENTREIVKIIENYRNQNIKIPHEFLPKDHANSPKVWEALLPDIPLTALLRTLGRLSSYGIIGNGQKSTDIVQNKLTDPKYVHQSRIHPLSVLIALKTYNKGRGLRGNLEWNVSAAISDMLDKLFYLTFDNVEPTNKRILYGIDISGSMSMGMSGNMNLSCSEIASVLAMASARTERYYSIMGFDSEFRDLRISPNQSVSEVMNRTQSRTFGMTDCALPMLWAQENDLEYDAFVVLTDSETYYGNIHPHEALKKYRKNKVSNAKLAVVGMTASNVSIADPSDAGMLDVVGASPDLPAILSDFISE